jgi:acid phosphatase family membrane protein YuiD
MLASIHSLFSNHILVPALIAWSLAQAIKVPLDYLQRRRWNWALLFSVGGMPSSHSALVAATAHAIGLQEGFDSPLFALAVVVAVVVIYDATGIRRQAGRHAEIINTMINELALGHPLKGEQLREVLGHTPLQVLAGTLLGLAIAQLYWMIWR